MKMIVTVHIKHTLSLHELSTMLTTNLSLWLADPNSPFESSETGKAVIRMRTKSTSERTGMIRCLAALSLLRSITVHKIEVYEEART